MEILSIRCDGCGIEKKETNHWWRLWIQGTLITIVPLAEGQKSTFPGTRFDCCGEPCLFKKLSLNVTGK